ncbi:alpha/beta hydrolase fold domain-containing protein [Corynebacterium mendelii]|uniref:Alpha/beta hydrolase fold domain-containing protein n=1 Tax=Corynebacterium mendelii TaxID=2765362 RepID=A0A939IXF6_9CORY|nr:alpha/beta hydrolase fold domain-containing protein [Corynebacterium mendelii]MBN9644420.1 alpha/beta hydrolase fold domain-containing protein [Corynebacterium mendelii]
MSEEITSSGPSNVHDPDTGRDFVVGGTSTPLDEGERLEQLSWYFSQHYPAPDPTPPWAGGTTGREIADNWAAKLPDRLTHTSMVMLGSACDHTMPGVAYTSGHNLHITGTDSLTVITPDGVEQSGTWIVSVHGGGFWRGGGAALEFSHRPEAAALGVLAGATVVDVDYPLAPEATLAEQAEHVAAAIDHAKDKGASRIVGYGVSAGAGLLAGLADRFDALVMARPQLTLDSVPDEIRGGFTTVDTHLWPEKVLFQTGNRDIRVTVPLEHVLIGRVATYTAQHCIVEPRVARQRLVDAASFIAGHVIDDPRAKVEQQVAAKQQQENTGR